MLSSVALLIEINLCNLRVQMLFLSPWLNAITRGEYLYFIILLKLIEGSWMYKVLESVTLDTQHVISWMHLKTHELSLVLQKMDSVLLFSPLTQVVFRKDSQLQIPKECFHFSALLPGNISHECWITLALCATRCVSAHM